jgi:hypothetical protein
MSLIDNWHIFVKYLFKTEKRKKKRFDSFKFNFPKFQKLKNKHAKHTLYLCICNSNPKETDFQELISTNINRIFKKKIWPNKYVNDFCAKIQS